MPHAVSYFGDKKTLFWFCGCYAYASVTLPKNARVLEIGGGQDPHPAGDVLVEKFLDNNMHRMMGTPPVLKGSIVVQGKPGQDRTIGQFNPAVVCADAEALPFEDKSFDFVITKDVLEHVPDIAAACREIGRVGRGGFIDVPRLESEWLFPQGIAHRWVFDLCGNSLVAREIKFQSPFGKPGDILHRLFADSVELQDAWARSRYYFHVVCMWRDHIPLTIGEPAEFSQVPTYAADETLQGAWVEGAKT